jgi:NAD(P)-dependent dehydrogenase (short-subunit alcohol dehydrogenase family)
MKLLTNKIALVAGGTGGVGEGIVRALLLEDAIVIVPARSAEKVEALRAYVSDIESGNLITLIGDLSTLEGISAFQLQIRQRFDHLDLVVASLGGWWQGLPLTSVTMDTWNQILANNLTSHFLAIKGFVPFLSPKTGAYVHINGFSADEPYPMAAPIAMTAAAQKSLIQSMALELKPTGIKVWELILGPMQTRDRIRKGAVRPDFYTPEEIGAYIVNLYTGNNENRNEVLHYVLGKLEGNTYSKGKL